MDMKQWEVTMKLPFVKVIHDGSYNDTKFFDEMPIEGHKPMEASNLL